MTAGIMQSTVRSASWVFAWRMATRLLGLVSTLILIRILAPQDFGLVALGTAFAQTVDALSTLGVEDALIREQQPTRAMYNTAFTMNLVRGLVIGGLIAVGSGPAAIFFGEPRLAPLLLVLGGLAASDGLLNIGIVDFRRDFQFHKEFLLNVLPRLASVAVTVGAAVLMQSYWALLAGMAVNRLLRLAVSYGMHPFRPRPTLVAWRSLLAFSIWSWVLALIGMMQQRSDSFVIGRISGTAEVGLYALGAEIAAMASTELAEPLGRAAYSGFSAARRLGGAEAMLIRLLSSALVVTMPVGLGLSLVAGPLVRVAMGEHWLQATPLIVVLAPVGGITALATISAMLLRAHGWLHRVAAISASGVVLRLVLMVWLLGRFGLPGAAAGTAIAVVAETAVMLTVASNAAGMHLRSLLAQAWRPIVGCAAMAGLLWATGLGWTPAPTEGTWADSVGQLCARAAIGAATYTAVLLALWAAQGWPPGPERDLLTALVSALRRVRGGLRRRPAAGALDSGKAVP